MILLVFFGLIIVELYYFICGSLDLIDVKVVCRILLVVFLYNFWGLV